MELRVVDVALIFVSLCGIGSLINAQLHADFERVDCEKIPKYFDIGTVRIQKFNRSSYVLNGELELKVDLDNSYEFSIDAGRSQTGSKFVTYPLKIPKTKMCDYLNGTYKSYQNVYAGKSNLPQVTKEGKCPLDKNKYYFKNLAMDSSPFPPMLPDGNWRLTLKVLPVNKPDPIINCALYVKITHPLM